MLPKHLPRTHLAGLQGQSARPAVSFEAMESAEPRGMLRLAKLRVVQVPEPGMPATAVWLIELRDVTWAAPDDWMQQLEDVMGSAAASDGRSVKESTPEPGTFEVVVHTNTGAVQLITLRHKLSAQFESWCEPVDALSDSQQEPLTRKTAETRIREILTENFDVPSEPQVLEAELEYGSEWLFKFVAGTTHYVGTCRRDHRSILFHVAHPLAD